MLVQQGDNEKGEGRSRWSNLSATASFWNLLLQIGCEAGCPGFMDGRAVWREAINLQGKKRTIFLANTAVQRFKELERVAQKYSLPSDNRYSLPEVNKNWHQGS
jgi:tagatose-1,6-bisphosphate aldolase